MTRKDKQETIAALIGAFILWLLLLGTIYLAVKLAL